MQGVVTSVFEKERRKEEEEDMEEVKAAEGSGSGLSIGFYDGRVHMCFGLLAGHDWLTLACLCTVHVSGESLGPGGYSAAFCLIFVHVRARGSELGPFQ